ncbi:MAG: hypothetical protein JXQ27_10075 [Acidobacteria bacterium]|nr:hypothetical protein [Acidobacteriota bacterium]
MRKIGGLIIVLLCLVSSVCPSEPPDNLRVTVQGRTYPLYPDKLVDVAGLPSPCTADDGRVIIIGHVTDGGYWLIPVTVENGVPLDYKKQLYGKGRQLTVDAADFPTLARTGRHDPVELAQTRTITGRPVAEITRLGRPMQSSRIGFMGSDEDIIAVLQGDNRLVGRLGLTHPDLARPLFHVWNIVLAGIAQGIWTFEAMSLDCILYNGRKVYVRWQGGRGWQESIFNDESLGQYHLEMWRELDPAERNFLNDRYNHLSAPQMSELLKKLSHIHTGEMVPYYITRYGFYEGHTDFRADPLAIVLVFGLRSLEELEQVFSVELYEVLTGHHTRRSMGGQPPADE